MLLVTGALNMVWFIPALVASIKSIDSVQEVGADYRRTVLSNALCGERDTAGTIVALGLGEAGAPQTVGEVEADGLVRFRLRPVDVLSARTRYSLTIESQASAPVSLSLRAHEEDYQNLETARRQQVEARHVEEARRHDAAERVADEERAESCRSRSAQTRRGGETYLELMRLAIANSIAHAGTEGRAADSVALRAAGFHEEGITYLAAIEKLEARDIPTAIEFVALVRAMGRHRVNVTVQLLRQLLASLGTRIQVRDARFLAECGL